MELIICLIGLILSFFFAGSEIAYISTNKFRYEVWLKKKYRPALMAKKYFDKPDLFLSTTLVGNNLSNVLASSYATIYLITFIDEALAWALITFTILLIGEIIPKILFQTYAHQLILKIIYPIKLFHILLNPVIIIANKISTSLIKVLGISRKIEKTVFDKQDIHTLLDDAKVSGVVDEDEQKIISRVLNLPDTLVREAMIPRTAIQAIEENTRLSNVRDLIAKSGKTKIPVYKSSIDNIIGIVFMFDTLKSDQNLSEIIRPVMYVPENKKCNELLKEFQDKNMSIAIIIDEYGGTAGIVTVEDLIEELFGEIEEASEKVTQPMVKINKTTWRINASESVDIINESLNVNIPDGEYETVAGFILSELGRIPESGEKIAINGGSIIVSKSSKSKIEQVRIVVRND